MTKEQFLAKWVRDNACYFVGRKVQFTTEQVLNIMEAYNTHVRELEAHANSKMDMNRPDPKDIFGKNATPESIKKMYADSPDLLKYAQALDDYIDWREENSKMPSDRICECGKNKHKEHGHCQDCVYEAFESQIPCKNH